MPENLPLAIIVLLWLLSGVITLGYLIMAHTWSSALLFAVPYYGVPVAWRLARTTRASPPSD